MFELRVGLQLACPIYCSQLEGLATSSRRALLRGLSFVVSVFF